MTSESQFNPDWVSPPGDTITEILRARSKTIEDLARDLGKPREVADELLSGRTKITLEFARALSRSVGASVEFWMAREYQYRESLARLRDQEAGWLKSIPFSDLAKLGWVSDLRDSADRLGELLRFFDVASLSAWHQRYAGIEALATFRTSRTFESSPVAVAAWLRQGELEGAKIDCAPWDSVRFRDALTEARGLSRIKEPSNFLPKLQRICAAAGVAVIALRAPTGCRASGATRWITPTKAILLLSFRHLTDDHFWFTFFHEAGHLLLHSDRQLIVEGLDEPKDNGIEAEANKFAADWLIPEEFEEELRALPPSYEPVIRFAGKIGIAPGIVVGQMQYLGLIGPERLNKAKRQYRWAD